MSQDRWACPWCRAEVAAERWRCDYCGGVRPRSVLVGLACVLALGGVVLWFVT